MTARARSALKIALPLAAQGLYLAGMLLAIWLTWR